LHDGAGLSDATTPNGNISNVIFENVDYDLLTIGNHELYVTEIAYETFSNFSKVYGDKYLTSNVQIINPATNQFEYIGEKYRYFTTEQGKLTSNNMRSIADDVKVSVSWLLVYYLTSQATATCPRSSRRQIW
jgi:2',3'-cyclic-nucleotide 2'-phosphodiesterase (5'-nucleotidase family)